MATLIDKIYYFMRKGSKLETKFASYQGYHSESIIKWKNQTGLSWSVVYKLLENFNMLNARKIRQLIKKIVDDHESLFSQQNCYITGFGNAGKSGDIILYDFTHTMNIDQSKIKKTWELNDLPAYSTIIFVEDIIGTGTQSIDYIHNKVNQIIKPSHKPYILSLFATSCGRKAVLDKTHFKVLTGILLEEKHQHYSDKSNLFNKKERVKLINLNKSLKKEGVDDFDLGLILAFYYAIPNNTMPIFWKDNYPFCDNKGHSRKWSALLPRWF